MNRKIVIDKIGKKEKTRTMVELDNDVHAKVGEIAYKRVKQGITLDVNSLYPSMMHSCYKQDN